MAEVLIEIPNPLADLTKDPALQVDHSKAEEMHRNLLNVPEAEDLDTMLDNASDDYLDTTEQAEGEDAIAEMEAELGSEETPVTTTPGTPEAGAPQPKDDESIIDQTIETTGDIISDVGRGIVEFPLQVGSGVAEAFQNTIQLADDVAQDLSERFPALGGGIVFDPKEGLKIVDKEQFEKFRKEHPELDPFKQTGKALEGLQKDPKSVTGGLVRGASQFLAGFAGGGKALKGFKFFSKSGPIVKGAIKGAVSDFAVFDGHEKRLSDLIQDQPALKNPVTEFLAADPNDTKLEGRFKNAVEGLGIGILAEGLIKGLRAVRASRMARSEAKAAAQLEADDIATAATKDDVIATLGDIEGGVTIKKSPSLSAKKINKAEETAAGAKPDDAIPKDEELIEDINWARINEPDDIKKVMSHIAKKDKGIEGAKRGVRTWEQTKLSASHKNAWKALFDRRKGAPLNAEESLAARNLWATSANKLREVSIEAATNPSEVNLFKFQKMLSTHYAIQREVLGARAETARALNAWKIPSSATDEFAGNIGKLLENAGGVKNAQLLANKVAMLAKTGNMEAMESMVQGGMWKRTADGVRQVWINSLLTNPTTHVANGVSNTGVMVQAIYERGTAARIGALLGDQNGVALGEATTQMSAINSAWKDALRSSWKNIKSGKSDFAEVAKITANKVEIEGGALAPGKWNFAEDSFFGHALKGLDTVTQIPGRMLAAGDEFFKTMGYRMELHAQALRQATLELGGDALDSREFRERVAAIIKDPPKNIKIESVDAALYNTFTQKPAESFNNIAEAIRGIPVIGRIIMPFKNTPINIMTYSFERTPLAPLVGQWRADIAAGGARNQLALAKMSTGTMMTMAAMDLAFSGKITGRGPDNPAERQALKRTGWQPYSWVQGEGENRTYVALSRLDPVSFPITMAADMAELMINAQEELDDDTLLETLGAMTMSTMRNVMSRTWMQGTADFFEAVENPKWAGKRYFQKVGGSLIPTGIAALARNGIPGVEGDPYLRYADGLIQELKRRTPGLSKDLPLYRDLWGRPVSYKSNLGWMNDMFNPIYIKKEDPQPVDKEFQRLNYFPKMPGRKISFNGAVLELDNTQYSRFVQLAGKEINHIAWGQNSLEFFNDLVTGNHPLSPVYDLRSDGPDGGKANYIRKFMNQFREQAKQVLIEEDDSLRAQYDDKRKLGGGQLDPALFGE